MYFCLCLFYYVMCCLLNISVSYSTYRLIVLCIYAFSCLFVFYWRSLVCFFLT